MLIVLTSYYFTKCVPFPRSAYRLRGPRVLLYNAMRKSLEHNCLQKLSTVLENKCMYFFVSERWKRFRNGSLKNWRSHNLSWLQEFKGPLHVTFYEDLKTNLRGELDAITQFLGVTPTFIECALIKRQGRYLRNYTKKPDFEKMYDDRFSLVADVNTQDVYQVIYSANHVTLSAMRRRLAQNRNRRGHEHSGFRNLSPNREYR